MMRAKLRKPRKRTSSFSKREKILRKPLSRRKSRSISLRLLIESAVVFPGLDAVGLWRNDRDHAQAEHQLSGFITLVGAVHQQRQAFRHRTQFRQQGATFGSIVRMAGRQGEGYGR